MKKLMLVIAAVMALAACKADRHGATPALADLSASLDPARAEFNAHAQEARFLTLLAPT